MKLSKNFLITIVISILLLSLALYLGGRVAQRFSEVTKPSPTGVIPPDDRKFKIGDTGFDNENYVNPIERGGRGTPSTYQIRGQVASWSVDNSLVTVELAGRSYGINVPSTINLRCMSETVTGPDGEVVDTSSIYLDFRNATNEGSVVSAEKVSSELEVGSEVTVQAEGDINEELEATMFVGYGCTVE